MNEIPENSYGEFVLELDEKNAFEPRVLEPVGQKHFGERSYEETVMKNIRIKVGQRPYAVNLTDLFLKHKNEAFRQYGIFEDFNFCLLMQSINVLNDGGVNSLVKLGYRMRFTNASPITVIDVLPKTEFIENASGKLNVSFDASGTFGVGLPEQALTALAPNMKAGAKLEASLGAEFKYNLSFNVVTPKIIAVGGGDNTSEWIFHRHDKPLTGTHKMVQLIMTRKTNKRLKFEFNVNGTISLFGWPTKYSTDAWYPLEADIPKVSIIEGVATQPSPSEGEHSN